MSGAAVFLFSAVAVMALRHWGPGRRSPADVFTCSLVALGAAILIGRWSAFASGLIVVAVGLVDLAVMLRSFIHRGSKSA